MSEPHDGQRADEGRPPVQPAEPCAMVIFGAGGDLTRRKLMPALINLRRSGFLPDRFAVVAVVRGEVEEGGFRTKLLDDITGFLEPKLTDDERTWLGDRLSLVKGNLDDAGTYDQLRAKIDELSLPGALFYLAVPPTLFGTIAKGLGAAGLAKPGEQALAGAWRRI